jgi:PPOX class probable F420-dependent enzyme
VGATQLSGLPGWALGLLETERVAHLGMLDDDDAPRVQPVTFALAEGRVWSAVDAKPKRVGGGELARVRFLRRRPAAALTVDRYNEEWSELAWVQVLGQVEILEAEEGGDGLDALVAKYAPYAQSPPPGPLLALEPRRCLCWRAKG